jgi:3-hydroxyacyl-CoA dehydrogenase
LDTLLCERGHFGQKTGRGFFVYDEHRKASPNPEVIALAKQHASEAGIPQKKATAEEIVERCVRALFEEGKRLLADGIALRSSDIDIVYINGYGFPAWRGGPMKYGEMQGWK